MVSMVDGIKDGKIVEEWSIYDSKAMMELIEQK
jgi:predicted ester cyclase